MPSKSKPSRQGQSAKKQRDDIGYIATRLARVVRAALAGESAKAKKALAEGDLTELEAAQSMAMNAQEHIRMQDAGFADVLKEIRDELRKLNKTTNPGG